MVFAKADITITLTVCAMDMNDSSNRVDYINCKPAESYILKNGSFEESALYNMHMHLFIYL